MKKFNKKLFWTVFIILIVLILPGYGYAAGLDEGTMQPPNIFAWILIVIFYILQFPMNTFLASLLSVGGLTLFFVNMIINSLLYALLIERVARLIKKNNYL